ASAFRIHTNEEIKEMLDELGGYHFEYRGHVEFEGDVKTTSYWLSCSDNFHKPLPKPPPLVS
ncbi:Retinal guanylyl cyclase 1, partial [Taenia solium]